MEIPVRCVCGQVYNLPADMAGKHAKCEICSTVFEVPILSAQVPAEQQIQNTLPQASPLAPSQPAQDPLTSPVLQQRPAGTKPQAVSKNNNRKINATILTTSISGGALLVAIILFFVFRGGGDGASKKTADSKQGDNTSNKRSSDSNRSLEENKRLATFRNNAKRSIDQNKPKGMYVQKYVLQSHISPVFGVDIESKDSPTMVLSRNGKYLGIAEDQSTYRDVGYVDFYSPRSFTTYIPLRGRNIKAISNDRKVFVIEDEGNIEVYDAAEIEINYRFNLFPGRISLAEDSVHFIVDDGEKTAVGHAKQGGVHWVQPYTTSEKKTAAWTGDLGFAYYLENNKIYQLDALTGKTTVHMDLQVGNVKFLEKTFSRNAAFFAAISDKKVYFFDIKNRKKVGEWDRPTDTAVSFLDVSNNGGTLAYIHKIKDDKGKELSEMAIVATQQEKHLSKVHVATQFGAVKVGYDGNRIATLTKDPGANWFLTIWQPDSTIKGDQVIVQSEMFFNSIPKPERWHTSFRSSPLSFKVDPSLGVEKIKTKITSKRFYRMEKTKLLA